MCGIFGIALKPGAPVPAAVMRRLLANLYTLSESRGKESAGLHLYAPGAGQAWTLKGAQPATELLRSTAYDETLAAGVAAAYTGDEDGPQRPLIAIAHSRLVTNGSAELPQNNQPVRWGPVTMIHNGIVVNVDALWRAHPHLQRHAEVDTEVMTALVADGLSRRFDPVLATREVFGQIKGAASVAWVHEEAATLTLATNTGDLYCAALPDGTGLVFASERYILENALKDAGPDGATLAGLAVAHVPPRTGLVFDLAAAAPPQPFAMGPDVQDGQPYTPVRCAAARQSAADADAPRPLPPLARPADESLLRYNEATVGALRRCTRCVLPETFPFIEFDHDGVCNYCHNYKPKYRGLEPAGAKKAFIESLQHYRRTDGSPDVLVAFSGGRDSSYGLHLIKKEFGLTPITFTYDWGMVTDLARRNIARICGQLGIQNILVSADIKRKRDNIRKNVAAWLKRPDLGLVPLFMAGDKHFFRVTNQLKRQTGIKLDLWCANPLENTDFKSGFCGVAPDFGKKRVDHLSWGRKLHMAAYYASHFLANPRYVNSSIPDTLGAFFAYYIEPRRDFYFIFDHMVWNEEEVNRALLSEYDWELAPDTSSTWRIGDGTAPFYNYIYVTARGFSEFDTFRSNQIREGMIGRDEALAAVVRENRPRAESLRWYLETIGLDFNDTIRTINGLDRAGLHR